VESKQNPSIGLKVMERTGFVTDGQTTPAK